MAYALCRLGPSSRLPRSARQERGAHSARDFFLPSRPVSEGSREGWIGRSPGATLWAGSPEVVVKTDIVTHQQALSHKHLTVAIETLRASKSAQPAVSQASVRVTGVDGGAVRRGPAGDVGRARHGRAGVAKTGRHSEVSEIRRISIFGVLLSAGWPPGSYMTSSSPGRALR